MKRPKGFMSTETYEKVLAKQELGFLELHGFGELLLHPGIYDFVRLGKQRGFCVKFSTNGLLLDETVMKRLRDGGLDGGLDLLYVSLRPFFEKTVSFLAKHYEEYEQMLSLLYIEHAGKMKPLSPASKVTRYEPHNSSGQVDMPSARRKRINCPVLNMGAVTVLWDG
jgi:hypothetical protein